MNLFKKVISCSLAMLMVSSICMPVFAADSVGSAANDYGENPPAQTVGQDTYQGEHSETNSIEASNTVSKLRRAQVYAHQDSTYQVILPKVIILDGAYNSGFDGAYTVSPSGNISGEQILTIEPDSSFSLSQQNKSDISASVTQNRTVFTYDNINTSTTGTVTASNVTAGSWHGQFDFNITLSEGFVYYTSIEGAVADANNLTTENADVASEDKDTDAEAGLFIHGGTAYIKLFKNTADTDTLNTTVPTVFLLNNRTLNLATGEQILAEDNLKIEDGTITSDCQVSAIETTEVANKKLVLEDVNLVFTRAANGADVNFIKTLFDETLFENVDIDIDVESSSNGFTIIRAYASNSKTVRLIDTNIHGDISNVTGTVYLGVGTFAKMENVNVNLTATGCGIPGFYNMGSGEIKNSTFNLSTTSKASFILYHTSGNLTVSDSEFNITGQNNNIYCIRSNAGTSLTMNNDYLYAQTSGAYSSVALLCYGNLTLDSGRYYGGATLKNDSDRSFLGNGIKVNGPNITITDTKNNLYVYGGGSGLNIAGVGSATRTVTNVSINGGTFAGPSHGGFYDYSPEGSTISINNATFLNTQALGQENINTGQMLGTMYFASDGTTTINNCKIIGGRYGIRMKSDSDSPVETRTGYKCNVTVANTDITATDYSFSTDCGTLNIMPTVTTHPGISDFTYYIDENPTINDYR